MQLAPSLPPIDIRNELCNALASEITKELDKSILREFAAAAKDITYNEYAMRATVAKGECMSKREFNKMKKQLMHMHIGNGLTASY